MNLDAVLEQIRKQGASQRKAVLADADLEAAHIIHQAANEIEDIRDHAGQEGETRGQQERAAILQQAQLDALIWIGKSRTTLVEKAIQESRHHFELIREDKSYPDVFQALLTEAIEEISSSLKEGDHLLVAVDPRDRQLLESFLLKIPYPVKTAYDLQSWGGVVVETSDHNVTVYNTLEMRLEHAAPYLHQTLAQFFESDL